MDTDKIIDELNKRFSEPLPEFYSRRIIFWYDEESEYAEKVDSIVLSNAKIVTLTGTNTFAVKKLLTADDLSTNYLVYRPFAIEDPNENWLLNIELYSEEYRSDLTSSLISELKLQNNIAIRNCLKKYNKFFKAKDRRKKATSLIEKKNISSTAALQLIIMASLCNITTTHPNEIIRTLLSCGLSLEDNSIYNKFQNFSIEDAFWEMVWQATGYKETEYSLESLAKHILITATSRTIKDEYLIGLEQYISISHQSHCYDFVSEWSVSESKLNLLDIAKIVEEELRLPLRFSKIPIDELANTTCFPCVNECILANIMQEVSDHFIEVDKIYRIIEKRRTTTWYDLTEFYFDGLTQVANMQSFYKEFSGNFHTVKPQEVWKKYAESYFKMDTYYRLYHLAFTKCLKQSHPVLDDMFKQLTDVVEGLYSNWFLNKLAENWTNACADELNEYGYISDIPKLSDFYSDNVKNSETYIYVIISDALRYEVAHSLADQLKKETQANVKINTRQATFPTTTKFGMASLLPHETMSTEIRNNQLRVLIDGDLSESNYRDKILKKYNNKSIVVKYDEIVTMKRLERSSLVKGHEIVYIYHDTIDKASHTSDLEVFPACDKAIDNIKNMIRIITSEFRGSRVLITADHGFLYTYSPLREDNKVDSLTFKDKALEYDRRYVIMQEDETPQLLLPVKMFNGNSNLKGFTPRENIRIKKTGSGLNYVHGGISLQEMVVPVIDYRFIHNSTKEYQKNKQKYDTKPVSLDLLSANRKISNMLFSLNFYQKEPVSDNRELATYLLYFVDSNGVQVSDTQKIIADKTSSNENDRTFRCNFSLKSLKFNNTESYYLVIAQKDGLDLPKREEFQIDIAFAIDDFDFFSE